MFLRQRIPSTSNQSQVYLRVCYSNISRIRNIDSVDSWKRVGNKRFSGKLLMWGEWLLKLTVTVNLNYRKFRFKYVSPSSKDVDACTKHKLTVTCHIELQKINAVCVCYHLVVGRMHQFSDHIIVCCYPTQVLLSRFLGSNLFLIKKSWLYDVQIINNMPYYYI